MIVRSTIDALAPLAISLCRAVGFDLDTRLYIPGTVLRGALAQAYLEEGGRPDDPAFQRVFVSEKVRFLDHRLNGAEHWPASVMCCADHGDSHRLVDLLLLAGRNASLAAAQCPDCRAKLGRVQGFWQWAGDQGANAISMLRVDTRRVAHSAIDLRTLATAREQFYSSRVICPGQQFAGSIRSESVADDGLQEVLAKIRKRDGHIHLGRGRTRGQGLARFTASQGSGSSEEELKDRLGRMNQSMRCEKSIVFTVTLQSATLLYDEWLLARDLEAADLSPELAGRQPVARFASTQVVAGWHAAAGLPKSEVTALSPGSCYLFRLALDGREPEAELDRLARLLAEVENKGVGERLSEGFGEVVICSDAHTALWAAEDR
jgi:CRISPR-associated protein Csx10